MIPQTRQLGRAVIAMTKNHFAQPGVQEAFMRWLPGYLAERGETLEDYLARKECDDGTDGR